MFLLPWRDMVRATFGRNAAVSRMQDRAPERSFPPISPWAATRQNESGDGWRADSGVLRQTRTCVSVDFYLSFLRVAYSARS
jgi:hypothetical protein